VVILLTLWTLANAAGFACFRGQARTVAEVPSPEIALGDFKFRADLAERGPVSAARFSLHVAFTPQSEQIGRDRLAARKFRVQQDVEELLRHARGADFDDPRLRELKRQIHEQINETLGSRVVADVIITDLSVDYSDRAGEPRPAQKPRG
jgi:flagellar basal body-associated protein FliL